VNRDRLVTTLTTILDATSLNQRPIAQCVFDAFIWASQERYEFIKEEMMWFCTLVSDRFVEEFSIPYQI